MSDTHEWRNLDMPMRLFHPEYRTRFRFGAIAMVLGISLNQVEHGLDIILNDATE
jgi:hypothetical protein